MRPRAPATLVVAVALLAVPAGLAGCGGGSGGRSTPRAERVTVFAAASLTDVFPAVARAFAAHAAAAEPRFSFAGSQSLAAQVANGAPADVLATADAATIATVAGELASPARTFAHNGLVIVTTAGNPRHISRLADLADPDLVVVLADPSVPAGHYAAQALATAGVDVSPRSLELDVRSVLTKVELGEADAGIVYRTDARAAADEVDAVPIPDAPTATYRIGALDDRGRAFVDFVLSARGQAVLRTFGFSP